MRFHSSIDQSGNIACMRCFSLSVGRTRYPNVGRTDLQRNLRGFPCTYRSRANGSQHYQLESIRKDVCQQGCTVCGSIGPVMSRKGRYKGLHTPEIPLAWLKINGSCHLDTLETFHSALWLTNAWSMVLAASCVHIPALCPVPCSLEYRTTST